MEASAVRVSRLNLELSSACDHACDHCFNVWNADPRDPQGGYRLQERLATGAYIAMLDRLLAQSGVRTVTFTGGEPLLRQDALEIMEHACQRVRHVQMASNGSHLTPTVVRRLATMGMGSVQLTLLSADRATHDRLKGAVCFDDTVRAMLHLREAGVPVQVCFVAMAESWTELEPVMELAHVLGAASLSYNRMTASGWGVHHVDRLMPEADHVEHSLAIADRLGRELGLPVTTSIPIPPCVVSREQLSWVRFGSCSTGSSNPSLVVDGRGNVRSCNLSTRVLGNILEQDWDEIMAHPYPRAFRETLPEMCRGCDHAATCRGGCKESAFATFGDHRHPEPFVHLARRGRRPMARRHLPILRCGA